MSKSLQEITDAWGRWMGDKYSGSGGVKFTASTNYNAHSELNQYHQYQVSSEFQDLVYDPYAPSPIPGSVSSITTTYENGSSVQQSITYEQSINTERSFAWSVTEELKIGTSVTVEASVPEVAKASGTVTTEIGLSSTQGSTETKTQTWTVTYPLLIPPYTSLKASLVVATQQYDIKWSANVKLDGSVAIWFNKKVALNPNDYHWLWFIPIESVFYDCKENNIIDISGYSTASGGVVASAQGKFMGEQGVSQKVKVTTEDYPTSKAAKELSQVQDFVLSVSKGRPALFSGD